MSRRLLVILIPVLLLISIYIYLYKKSSPANEEKKLTIYTYSSFASSWGPGPDLKTLFKNKTGIDVDFVDVGEAGIIVQRVLLEKENPKADIVLGLDQFQLASTPEDLFLELPKLDAKFDESAPISKIQKGPFVAYNWAPMTFIFRNTDKNILPKKLEDFASDKFKNKIILLDPRTSSPGFIFFNWVVQKYGEEKAKEFFEKLKKNVYTITPSWSAGYGLFKKKQADYVFSYLTSPAYHWIEEKDFSYEPLYLEESLPYHIEYISALKSSKNLESTQEFIKFLVSPEAQEIIMNKNYMLPVTAGVSKNEDFKKLKNVELFESSKEISRDEVLKIWKSISW